LRHSCAFRFKHLQRAIAAYIETRQCEEDAGDEQ
jgi:hypothetical protein